MHMHCDAVGNVLLAKLACQDASDCLVIFPAEVVFWMLKNLPPYRGPALTRPTNLPTIVQEDWNTSVPRVLSVQCVISHDGFRMTMNLDAKKNLTAVMSAATLELMRQLMFAYHEDLFDPSV